MSVMKPMRTGPALFWATAARLPRPRAMAATRVLIFMETSPWGKKSGRRLDAEVFLQHGHVVLQLVLREFADDLAVLHHVEAVGQRRGEAEVLFDQHDGVALGLERADHLGQLLHDDGGEALG